MSLREAIDERMSRRDFLNRAILGLSGLAAAIVGVPIVAYLFSPLIHPKHEWQPVGPIEQFEVGATTQVTIQDPSPLPWAGQTALTAAWLRRNSQNDFTCFAVNCTHLGCPVNWLQDAQLFLCPCHGGVYYADGTVAGGPPPKPLWHLQTRLNNGQVEVRTRGLQVG
jgi:menaquinol-cytochrome c reductase iron-sulfur subunit